VDSSQSVPIQYEKFVRDIISGELSKIIPGGRSTVTHNRRLVGKSGHKHQIDIFAEITIAEIELRVVVECKFYSQRVGVDDVLEFSTRIQDISAHKGIIVTTVGFQEGALNVARSYGIALVKVGKLAFKGKSSGWETVLSTPTFEESTPGERFAKWLGEGKSPARSIANEGRFFDRLNVGQEGILSSDTSGTFFQDAQGEWLVAYSVLGEHSEIIVNRDGLLAVMFLFRHGDIHESLDPQSILDRLFTPER